MRSWGNSCRLVLKTTASPIGEAPLIVTTPAQYNRRLVLEKREEQLQFERMRIGPVLRMPAKVGPDWDGRSSELK